LLLGGSPDALADYGAGHLEIGSYDPSPLEMVPFSYEYLKGQI
jgi:hypothetical protein